MENGCDTWRESQELLGHDTDYINVNRKRDERPSLLMSFVVILLKSCYLDRFIGHPAEPKELTGKRKTLVRVLFLSIMFGGLFLIGALILGDDTHHTQIKAIVGSLVFMIGTVVLIATLHEEEIRLPLLRFFLSVTCALSAMFCVYHLVVETKSENYALFQIACTSFFTCVLPTISILFKNFRLGDGNTIQVKTFFKGLAMIVIGLLLLAVALMFSPAQAEPQENPPALAIVGIFLLFSGVLTVIRSALGISGGLAQGGIGTSVMYSCPNCKNRISTSKIPTMPGKSYVCPHCGIQLTV